LNGKKFKINFDELIINTKQSILVTGASGFIGSRVVDKLLEFGFKKISCFTRLSSNLKPLLNVLDKYDCREISIIKGNLLSDEDCLKATENIDIVIHLVAGRGKSFPGCFLDSVVATRNLLDACVKQKMIKRFVNVSSLSVYSNFSMRHGSLIDENCQLEDNFLKRYDAYAYAKFKQDELVLKYHKEHGLPYVIARPTVVIGPGKKYIPAQVGIDTFGFFIHVGGSNIIPITYVDNCADAIVLSGLRKNVEGVVFNIVDDDLPNSRFFLKSYKKHVGPFFSLYVPYGMFFIFSYFWERYANLSEGQVPPVFNRRQCSFVWKKHKYTNQKIKEKLKWEPRVPMQKALKIYFDEESKLEDSR
jgi:nucleoside-diphosphate-sugar epimerase